jgi:hypothetical protein
MFSASGEVDLEVNSDKTKYMIMSHHQKDVGQSNIKTSNK